MATDFVTLFNFERCKELLAGNGTAQEKELAIFDECHSEDFIYLDYWACYVDVFDGTDPPESISGKQLLPELQEEIFVLLLPQHVDLMLLSLKQHENELVVMADDRIAKLETWRDLCISDKRFLVAYHFD
jgi:hypothetical protein